MSDTVPTPVPGDPDSKGAPDGVSAAPGHAKGDAVHGRSEGGESGGGSYPNPHSGNGDPKSEFFSNSGQTPNAYHGSGQAGEESGSGPNGVSGSGGEAVAAPVPMADRTERQVDRDGAAFSVVETSGVAEAETQGKIANDAPYEKEQEQPGSG